MTARRIASKPNASRSITLLGATGSIGSSTLDLLERKHRTASGSRRSPRRRNATALGAARARLGARFAAVADPRLLWRTQGRAGGTGDRGGGRRGCRRRGGAPPGRLGHGRDHRRGRPAPTLAAVERGATVALANKECLVCAGTLFMRRAGEPAPPCCRSIPSTTRSSRRWRRDAARTSTASSSPRRAGRSAPGRSKQMRAATRRTGAAPSQLVDGPEGHDRFRDHDEQGARTDRGASSVRLAVDQIDVLVHPQSIVHGIVEFRDGSMIAQLGPPDMRVPIAHCLAWPDRMTAPAPRLDLAKVATLTFEAPDPVRFPALAFAREALEPATGRHDHSQCRQRDRGRGVPAAPSRIRAEFAALVEATIEAARRRGIMREPQSSTMQFPLTIFRDLWRGALA